MVIGHVELRSNKLSNAKPPGILAEEGKTLNVKNVPD